MIPTSRRWIILIVVLSLLPACATAPPRESPAAVQLPPATEVSTSPPPVARESSSVETVMRDLSPRNGTPVFLGISSRLQNRDDELPAALLHAAEQASRYVRLRAEYRYISESDGSGIGYLDDIETTWDGLYADELVSTLEILQTLSDNDGSYVLVQVPGIPPAPSLSFSPGDAEPAWIITPPTVPGYLVTVGLTTASRRFRNSIDRADQEALKGLLQQTGTTVRLMEEQKDQDRRGTRVTVISAQEAAATLQQFYVIARFISADRRYYYSLALAREE